jgi:hypothetical protein
MVSDIPGPSRGNLGFPGFGQLVRPLWESPSMPEVTIDEYGDSFIPEHEIWPAGQIAGLGLVPPTCHIEGFCDKPLGPRIPSLDSCHHLASLFRGHDVPTMAAG